MLAKNISVFLVIEENAITLKSKMKFSETIYLKNS